MVHQTRAEQALADIVDYAAECGLTSADIDQDATEMRERLCEVLGVEEISVSVALGVAAGVWALQGHLLSDEEFYPKGSAATRKLATMANMTIVFLNQILQGARAAEMVAELMGPSA